MVAILVAVIAYGMPVGTSLAVATEGAAFGLFPIMWIVWNAIWIYDMTVETGHFAVLRRSFATISDDQRIQAVIIAFCFGALLEALAGFGTPVAITAVMLIAVGFKPLQAAAVALVANTAPVAFGAIATPIVTLAELTDIPKEDLGAMVGRQTPLLAVFVPLILVGMIDGRRGIRAVWPAALVAGMTFAVGQFVSSNYISVELTDIIGALLSVGALVLFLRVWQPSDTLKVEPGGGQPAIAGAAAADPAHEAAVRRREGTGKDSRGDVFKAYAPYLIIIVVFSLAQWGPIKDLLAKGAASFTWPGTGDIQNAAGEAPSATTYNFAWLGAAGTLLLFSGFITMAVLKVSPVIALRDLRRNAQPAQVGNADRRRGAGARLRHEPVGADALDRQLDRRRRWLAWRSCRRSSAGSASPSRARTRRRIRSSACSRSPRRRRPGSTRPCWPRPTRAAACWAR